ncbi:FG-GAP-like repeat-containing protein [Galbibacter sp. EGI 63066]|uniref:FG-GAP-like repeat-containing protein n=1 Tax=Galbibacter sp. EGI 63066 TaxID=2993559 RepID=UPI002249A23F|nr:FG-GAP-like repeat-containing protein [Galbibacter sp. EGI 63066]MCX2681631.1 FG-GAP-like repeat-containing protein [Galbibacter sp. EGI 63066]
MKNKIAAIFALCCCSLWSQERKLFTEMTSEYTGVNFENTVVDDKQRNILLYANFYGGGGVGVADFNKDGLSDIYFAGNMVDDVLYLNEGDFKFKDITKNAHLVNDGGWSTGVTIADVNNDGYPDIYVSRELYDHQPELRRNLLYINNGDLTFTESAEKYGVANTQRTRHATFLDYNKDGHLDLFLLTQPPNPGSYSEYYGTTLQKPEYHLVLYKNTGKGKFIEVSKEAGVALTGFPNAASVADLNNDGWPDIYVANDFYAPDFLLMNNQNGTFTNVANTALNHMSYYSMGVDVSDINDDGFLDVFVVDMVAEDNFRLKANMSGMNPKVFWNVVNNGGHYQYMFNTFHLNNGNRTFSDVAQITGMAATDWSWANLIADFDNDGLKDAYITNGLLRDIRNTDADKKLGEYVIDVANIWVKENPNAGDISIWDILDLEKALSIIPSQPIANYAFKNNGDLNFTDAGNDWGLDQKSFSNGAAYADFDNDGDLDLVVNNINDKAFLFKNNSQATNYIRLKLASKNNLPTYSSRIELRTGDKKQFFETTNVRGIYSTSEDVAHFGLGDQNKVDEITVTWSNGRVTYLENVDANQELELFLEDAKKDKKQTSNSTDTFFSDITTETDLQLFHRENKFNDYDYQVLLPHKMSQFGPALAVGDVNNDGKEDVFVGGAAGFSATLYVQEKGGFKKTNQKLWDAESEYEDVDAEFIDVNNDGNLDLYAVSGGNEFEEEDVKYKDRLYLNDGKGNFTKEDIGNLKNISGSIVKAIDFDKDGDLDLFVGARLKPRKYPEPVSSMILVNENGKLINKTKEIAPELKNLGMVTDAIWVDYDDDGWEDLVVVGEWMPVTVFKNKNGILEKENMSDLKNTKGWWFSIEKGDFDNDGDMDFIAGNIGLNYKYKTSTENPFDVYYHDFDSNGSNDIVLGYYQENKHYPLRGFSCSSQQVPSLKNEIKKYDVFASLELEEVYGEEKLEEALHYTADTFASVYIENRGNGQFKISKLPNMAQLSNINDFLINDYNNDGNIDVLATGNLFVSEIETTRNDAGTGVLLLGDGKGGFSFQDNTKSGFFTRGDAKKIKFIQDKVWVIVGNNNDMLQIFKFNH